jgi:hypothetical protein
MTAPSLPITRREALAELRELYGLLAGCGDRWQAATPAGRWGPPDYVQDEINADLDAYRERVKVLEAFLVGGAT